MLYGSVPLSDLCSKDKGPIVRAVNELSSLVDEFPQLEKTYKQHSQLKSLANSIVDTLGNSKQLNGLVIESEDGKTTAGGLGGLYYKLLSEAFPKELKELKFTFSESLGTETGLYTRKGKVANFSSPELLDKNITTLLKTLGEKGNLQAPVRMKLDNLPLSTPQASKSRSINIK
jgi:hypothetical protein